MNFILVLSILLVPLASIITIPGTIVWWPQFLALQFFGGICFASKFWKINKFLALFVAYLFFSYIFVTMGSPRNMLCLTAGALAIAVVLPIQKINNLKYVYVALIFMSLLNTGYSIFQYFGIDPVFVAITKGQDNVVSFLGSRDQLGIYSCAMAFWNPWLIPFALIPILLCKCLSGFIGICAGGLFYAYFKIPKRIFLGLLGICLAVIIFSLSFFGKSHEELMERIDLWKLTVSQSVSGKAVINMPQFTEINSPYYIPPSKRNITWNHFFGCGIGNFFTISNKTQKDILYYTKIGWAPAHIYEHAHNDILEAFYELGFLGLSTLLFVIAGVCLSFLGAPKSTGVIATFSSLVAQGIASMSVYVFHAPVSLFIFCLTLGLFYKEVANAQQSEIQ